MHTVKEVLVEAYQRGHAWNPDFPSLRNLDLARVNSMVGNEPDAKLLIESYQRSSSRYNLLVEAFHQRFEPAYDGVVGPATLGLANSPRCPLPDFPPPFNATFHYDDPDIQRAVERMQAATGKGSWLPGCYGTTGVHEIKVSYDTSKLSSKQKEWMNDVKVHNAMAVGAMGLKIIEVPVGEKANVTFYGKSWGGSIIGMAEFNNSSCNDTVFCTVSPSFGPNYRMFLILVLHEFGHTMNFEHSTKYIMNPYIMDQPEYWVQRDASGVITYQDVRYVKGKQFFGGEPVGPIVPIPTQKPIVNGEMYIDGNGIKGIIDVTIVDGQKAGKFPQTIVSSINPGKFRFSSEPPIIWTI